MGKIIVVSDEHCRSFYKPVLNVKDTPVIFMGDYMDPYYWEGFTDEEGIEKLKEIIEFAKNNKNVVLLAGNHDCSHIWSYMGFERTSRKYYQELHKIYRDNIDLFHPIYKVGDTIFTHAGINDGWIKVVNEILANENSTFQITEDNVLSYIENEWITELEHDEAPNQHFMYCSLDSRIFDIGRSRGGDAPYGGPFWSDLYDDWGNPEGWNCVQVFSHQQGEITGQLRTWNGGICVDSRAIFEYDSDTHLMKPSELNDEFTKRQIPEHCWKGEIIKKDDNYD